VGERTAREWEECVAVSGREGGHEFYGGVDHAMGVLGGYHFRTGNVAGQVWLIDVA
jgi:hypothetical protein